MWFWYAILSAVISAFSVILNKLILKKVNTLLLTWSLFALPLPLLFLLSFKDVIPKINNLFFLGITGSSLSFVFSKTITLNSIKNNLLSKIYPLVSFSTFFTYIFGLILLSESIKLTAVIGLLIIILGGYILNAENARENILKPFKMLFLEKSSYVFLFAMILSSATSIFDKIGLTNVNPSNPTFVLFSENAFMTVLLTGYLTHKDKNWVNEIKNNFWFLFLASLIYMTLVLVAFLGFISGPVALVIGVKKVEILFVIILSFLVFKDKPDKHSVIAAVCMLCGVILTKL